LRPNRKKDKEKRLIRIHHSIQKFEKKYQSTYKTFAQNLPNDFRSHEDWIEWTYFEFKLSKTSFSDCKINTSIG